ncbi:MAG: hypothetical protein CM15mP107_3470 [Bacteroidota bacterium]|nr:MAG: hypothetical protein CM15mP107_3470 [Bacteroidota bacterium]
MMRVLGRRDRRDRGLRGVADFYHVDTLLHFSPQDFLISLNNDNIESWNL